MTKKQLVELIENTEYKWTPQELDEVCRILIKDANGKLELFKYLGMIMYAFERTLNEYSEKLNYCFQNYIKCFFNAPEKTKKVGYPYSLFVEMIYLYSYGFSSEALYCVDELLGYEFYYPSYNYLAVCYAINMFLRAGLYEEAEEYVTTAEDMIKRTKEIYKRLPLTDGQTLYISEALLKYYIATGKPKKASGCVNILKKIRENVSENEKKTIDKDLLLAEACLAPVNEEIVSRFFGFIDEFKPEEEEVLQKDLDFLPVIRRIKDYASEEEIVKCVEKLLSAEDFSVETMRIYSFLFDELGISEEKYSKLFGSFLKGLRKCCVNSDKSSGNSLTNYQTRKKLNKDFKDRVLIDTLTGFGTRLAFEQKRLAHNSQTDSRMIVFMLDVNALKYVNDHYGHSEGNVLLSEAAKIMREAFGDNGKVYRAGGDEFIAIEFEGFIDPKTVVKKIHDGSKNFKGVHPYPVAISVGYVEHSEHPELAFDDLVKIADARMYEDKEKFYKKYPKYGRK